MSNDDEKGSNEAGAGERRGDEAQPLDGGAGEGRAALAQPPGPGQLHDSPAWYPLEEAHRLARPFVEQARSVTSGEDENGKLKKASPRQLAHLYCVLFSPMSAADSNGHSPFYDTIIELQTALRDYFKPHDPATTAVADAEVHRILRRMYRMTIRQRGQSQDYESKPPLNSRGEPELQLSREQLVELYHVLVAQSDVKLLSPWSVTVEGYPTGGW